MRKTQRQGRYATQRQVLMSTPRRYAPEGRYHRSEQLATLRWNEWPLWLGTTGYFALE